MKITLFLQTSLYELYRLVRVITFKAIRLFKHLNKSSQNLVTISIVSQSLIQVVIQVV